MRCRVRAVARSVGSREARGWTGEARDWSRGAIYEHAPRRDSQLTHTNQITTHANMGDMIYKATYSSVPVYEVRTPPTRSTRRASVLAGRARARAESRLASPLRQGSHTADVARSLRRRARVQMPCQGVAVMRRKSDGWLNATQILKVAGFDKPQRTRVLEREVQKGVHEKVQGGYGKYQGQ